ncbi:MAG: hypothetical protein ACQEXJ_23265 [Myxococcota bacterium]
MKRLIAILAVAGFSFGVVACEKQKPCDKVMEKMCEAAGEDMCAELEKKMAEDEPTAEDQAECEAMLKDDKKMQEMLDGLKAASALKKALDDKGGEAVEGAEGAEGAEKKAPTGGEEKPAAGAEKKAEEEGGE